VLKVDKGKFIKERGPFMAESISTESTPLSIKSEEEEGIYYNLGLIDFL